MFLQSFFVSLYFHNDKVFNIIRYLISALVETGQFYAEIGKVTLKRDADRTLMFFLKSNTDEALSNGFFKSTMKQ